MPHNNKIFYTVIGFLAFLAISFIANNQPAFVQADAAPPAGAIGSDLFPNVDTTKVRMESETVIIDIAKYSENRDGHAIVTAEFHMRNLGDEREEMLVRFPMNHTYNLQYELENKTDYCGVISFYPTIENFEVWVNEQYQNAEITTLTTNNFFSNDPEELITLNCWAKFNVIFPPGQEVVIKVQYKVPGYRNGGANLSYEYVLATGAGWYDTIGSADIIVRFPYEINEYNFEWARFGDYEISRNEILWHFEDFEPDYMHEFISNFHVEFLDPVIWNQILIERENIKINPNDGEAWGRLGKAYKEAVTEAKGYIDHNDEPELFQMSMDSYQKALELLPEDIEWHYGYAQLVCMDIMFKSQLHDDYTNHLKETCTEQLKYVLDHDPNHEATLNLLNWVRLRTMSYPEGEIAEFLILTPMPTRTQTIIPSATTQPKTPTLPLTWTPSPTRTLWLGTFTHTPILEPTQATNPEQNRLLFAVGANILFITLFFLAIRSTQPDK